MPPFSIVILLLTFVYSTTTVLCLHHCTVLLSSETDESLHAVRNFVPSTLSLRANQLVKLCGVTYCLLEAGDVVQAVPEAGLISFAGTTTHHAPADLWRRAVSRGHSAVTLRSAPTTR